MSIRTINQLIPATPTREGAGVRLHRGFGPQQSNAFDPFLLFDDFSSTNKVDFRAGFPGHPHRGIETVTYLLRGRVAHKDNLGNAGVIKEGDVQWMTAGSGIIHEEMPEDVDELVGFQLWVNLPKAHKMTAPRYRAIGTEEIPKVEQDGVIVRSIAGTYGGETGPMTDLFVDVMYLDVSLTAGATFRHTLPEHYTVLLYVVTGAVHIGERAVEAKTVIELARDGNMTEVAADEHDARFLFIAGVPIKESIAWRGPIVMNTEAEIETAFREIEERTFVKEDAQYTDH